MVKVGKFPWNIGTIGTKTLPVFTTEESEREEREGERETEREG